MNLGLSLSLTSAALRQGGGVPWPSTDTALRIGGLTLRITDNALVIKKAA